MLRVLCVFKVHSVLSAYRVQTEKEIVVASIPVLGNLLYLYRARHVSSINVLLLVRVFLFLLCSDVNTTHLRISPITLFLTFFRF